MFPLAPGSKVPAIPSRHEPGDPCRGECSRDGHGVLDATTDTDKVAYWFRQEHADRNIGLATGAPGPDVVDVDVRHGDNGRQAWEELADAGLVSGYHAIVTTPSGGWHAYYQGTEQPNGRLRDHDLDFRGKGGYVVAAGSTTPEGAYAVDYRVPRTGETVDWQAVRAHLAPEAQPSRAPRWREASNGSVDRLSDWVAARGEGDRNFPLFYASKQLAMSGLLDGQATERLVDAARQSGLKGGEREARATIESGRRSAQREIRPADREAG